MILVWGGGCYPQKMNLWWFVGRLTGVRGDDRGSCCSDDPEMRWESRGADAGGGSRQGEKRESRQTSWRTGQSSAQSGQRGVEDSRKY